jgi:hypothetical protein
MNCPKWEERVAGGDPEAAVHLRDCPSCAALADGLARDAGPLQEPNRPIHAPIPLEQVRSKLLDLLTKRAARSGTALGETEQAKTDQR